jgi:hypothetical protein
MQLGIEFPARVVVINGKDHVAGGAIMISAGAAHAIGCVGFEFRKGCRDGAPVGFYQALVTGELGQEGNGFGSGEREIVDAAFPTLDRAVGGHPIGAVARPEELTSMGIESSSEGLDVLVLDLTGKAKLPGAAAEPLADNTLALSVVIAVGEVLGGVAFAVGHGPDGQHSDAGERRP